MAQPRPSRFRLVAVPLPCFPGRAARLLADATGPNDWIALVRPLTLLRTRLKRVLWNASTVRPDVDLFFGQQGIPFGPLPTPRPAAGLTLLTAFDYIGLPLLVRGAALAALGGLRHEAGIAAGYDLCLRALSNGLQVGQLPLQFAHGMWPGSANAPLRHEVLSHWNAETGSPWRISDGARRGTLQVRRRFAVQPQVSIVLRPAPHTSPAGQRLEPLLDALAQGAWPTGHLDVLVDPRLDTGGATAGDRPVPWRKISVPAGSDEATHRNALWRAAGSELVIFIEAGLMPQAPDWIDALAGLAADRTVGMVSGRVMAGAQDAPDVAAGLFGFDPRTWAERGFAHRDYAVPISPLLATRKSMLERVNGFRPQVPDDYQAADAALRMRMLGQSVVVTPFASARSAAAAIAPDAREVAAFLAEWGVVVAADSTRFPDAPLRMP